VRACTHVCICVCVCVRARARTCPCACGHACVIFLSGVRTFIYLCHLFFAIMGVHVSSGVKLDGNRAVRCLFGNFYWLLLFSRRVQSCWSPAELRICLHHCSICCGIWEHLVGLICVPTAGDKGFSHDFNGLPYWPRMGFWGPGTQSGRNKPHIIHRVVWGNT